MALLNPLQLYAFDVHHDIRTGLITHTDGLTDLTDLLGCAPCAARLLDAMPRVHAALAADMYSRAIETWVGRVTAADPITGAALLLHLEAATGRRPTVTITTTQGT